MYKVLLKQMGADDSLRRQLEKSVCLNLSATLFLILCARGELDTHYIDTIVAHSGGRQYIKIG